MRRVTGYKQYNIMSVRNSPNSPSWFLYAGAFYNYLILIPAFLEAIFFSLRGILTGSAGVVAATVAFFMRVRYAYNLRNPIINNQHVLPDA